jgi:hypothetical protein
MSDQEFRGIAPKTPAGASIFFYSLDYWMGLCECIQMIIDEGFPPYPCMDADTAEHVADLLERRLNFGLVRSYFELEARHRLSDPDIPEAESEEEVDAYVETMLDWTRQYIAFLKECGGCEAV